MKGNAGFVAFIVFLVLAFGGIIATAVVIHVRDDHARSDCLYDGGQIVQASHGGDGWVCIRDGRPLP